MVVIDADGPTSLEIPWLRDVEPRLCIFEFAYIARPDSRLYGREVHEVALPHGRAAGAAGAGRGRHGDGGARVGRPGGRGLRPGQRHPLRAGAGEEPLHRPLLHRAGPAGAGRRGAAQAEPAHRHHRRQAAGRGGRLHRARHDAALGHPHAARGRRGRGPPAHLVAALALALLLRDRHAVARGAAGDRPHRRGHGAHSRRRLAGLHHHREPEGGHRRRRRVLRRLLHRATTRRPSRPSVTLRRPEPVAVTAHQAALPGV